MGYGLFDQFLGSGYVEPLSFQVRLGVRLFSGGNLAVEDDQFANPAKEKSWLWR